MVKHGDSMQLPSFRGASTHGLSMQAYVVSDHDGLADRVRNALLSQGRECPPSHVIPLDRAKILLAKAQAELVVVVLHPDPERALLVPTELRRMVHGRILAVG